MDVAHPLELHALFEATLNQLAQLGVASKVRPSVVSATDPMRPQD